MTMMMMMTMMTLTLIVVRRANNVQPSSASVVLHGKRKMPSDIDRLVVQFHTYMVCHKKTSHTFESVVILQHEDARPIYIWASRRTPTWRCTSDVHLSQSSYSSMKIHVRCTFESVVILQHEDTRPMYIWVSRHTPAWRYTSDVHLSQSSYSNMKTHI